MLLFWPNAKVQRETMSTWQTLGLQVRWSFKGRSGLSRRLQSRSAPWRIDEQIIIATLSWRGCPDHLRYDCKWIALSKHNVDVGADLGITQPKQPSLGGLGVSSKRGSPRNRRLPLLMPQALFGSRPKSQLVVSTHNSLSEHWRSVGVSLTRAFLIWVCLQQT